MIRRPLLRYNTIRYDDPDHQSTGIVVDRLNNRNFKAVEKASTIDTNDLRSDNSW